MNTFYTILNKTKSTFDYLDNQDEDGLDANCSLIFMLYGSILGFDSLFKDYQYFNDIPLIFLAVGFLLIGAGLGYLLGRHLITYILFGIGKLLNGKGKLIDIRTVAAYSFIPSLLKLLPILVLGIIGETIHKGSIIFWSLFAFYFVIWLWSIKIMIQGLLKFQKFGFIKSIINICPFLILGIISWILF